MGGPGTASLLSAIGGAGASTAGALTGKGDAGQPLVNLSQSLNQQDQQRAQLAQQAQQNALQQRRQEIQDARQNFYIGQSVKAEKRDITRDAENKTQLTLVNQLGADALKAKNLKENRAIEKEARNTEIAAEALAVKNDPARPFREGIKLGQYKTTNDLQNAVAAKGGKEETQAAIMNQLTTEGFLGFGKTIRPDLQGATPASGQPTQKILQYVPATKDTPAGVK